MAPRHKMNVLTIRTAVLVVFFFSLKNVHAFQILVKAPASVRSISMLQSVNSSSEDVLECSAITQDKQVERLQNQIITYGASYNRGFGASSNARNEVDSLISQLEEANEETNAGRGIAGDATDGRTGVSPLRGAWRMVWTTALDVLSLEASPLTTTGAIYQVFDPPLVTNVIDLLPSFLSLFPPSLTPHSLLRANVETKAYQRSNKPNRIGLEFRSVKLQPVQAFGIDVNQLPPFGFDLPRVSGLLAASDEGPGYFDVTFVDSNFLIIRQQGEGIFCLVKVDSVDA
jgi:hypothetical protein